MKRAIWLDSLRGLAFVWMVIFHFVYDLNMFSIVQINFKQGFWYAFPRLIAGTFLFCVGISLVFYRQRYKDMHHLHRRNIKLFIAAILISLTTYVLFPHSWIYFGTLHCIFLASYLGYFLVPYPKLNFGLLLLIASGQYLFGFDIAWISSLTQMRSMDFIPIYPWMWVTCLGIATGQIYHSKRFLKFNQTLDKIPYITGLNAFGKHSLGLYLIHQPILVSLAWILSKF